MNSKQVTYAFLLVIGMLMYQTFLIQRDANMFKAYDQQTPHEKYCKELKVWHPDCKIE